MRCLIFGAAIGALVGAVGCSGGDSSTSGGAGGHPELANVELEGSATVDELAVLLAATPVTTGELPQFTAPPQATIFAKGDPIPMFRWALEDEKGDEQATSLQKGTIEGTYLQFGALGQPKIARVFSSGNSFKPTSEQWKTMSIGTWVTVAILAARFHDGELEGDVTQGEPLAFCSAMKDVWQP